MTQTHERLAQVRAALAALAKDDLVEGARGLLGTLGYSSPKTLDTGGAPSALLDALGIEKARFTPFAGVDAWQSLDVLFQLTGDELPALARGSTPATSETYRKVDIDSFVFLALDLIDRPWTRRELVGITRELNRGFAMPAIVLFRHSGGGTLAVIDRRRNLRDQTRDVVGGRISLVKDIDLLRPHRAHLEILADLTLSSLRPGPADFRALYDGWLGVLSASELNKRFYKDLADWFAWASGDGVAQFPPGQGNGDGERQIGLIRLLTRLMFVWFVKQKGLIPAALFEEQALSSLLKEPPHVNPNGHGYYLAVLQNLFFACLNTDMPRDVPGSREWLRRDTAEKSRDYGSVVLRNEGMFRDPDAAKSVFHEVPFLNGGLFDPLDVHDLKPTDVRAARATKEGANLVLRVDGFSEEPDRQPRLPNRLFFGGQAEADLSAYYGRRTIRRAPGLIDLFERYKFTVEENTPLEEEAALDPELLGKVFENLLASYNEDTKTTARNKSGSFYTPREVVDFMVDEALVAYLSPVLAPLPTNGLRSQAPGLDFGPMPGELALERTEPAANDSTAGSAADGRLRDLLSYAADAPAFSNSEADALVTAIERCRAIDPAVGSGAFPLGLLQKLVHVLSRLDPGGVKWKAANRAPYLQQIATARTIKSPTHRAAEEARARERLAAFDAAWPEGSHAEYARKLYLIEGCLHGVDIQPIAVQIAKLRCFISLAVEQEVAEDKPNRGVLALPNLELKFVAANALGLVGRAQTVLNSDETRSIEADWRDTAQQLFSARDRRMKRSLKQRFEGLREKLASSLVADGMPEGEATLMARWDPFDANSAAGFFSPEWMFGLGDHDGGCFDIVLANPPYVRHEKIESYLLDGRPANSKRQLAMNYATAAGTADLLVYFFERAVRLLRPAGAVAFITSNTWYRAGYGAKLRAWLSAETHLRAIIDFGDAEVFEAIAYPTIVIGQKRPSRSGSNPDETFCALNWTPGEAPDGFPARFAVEAFAMPQSALLPTGWQFQPQGKRDVLDRLMQQKATVRSVVGARVSRGLTTGFNDAFVIDEVKRLELIDRDPGCAHLFKPYLAGRNIKRWSAEESSRWIIKIPSSENVSHQWSGKDDAVAESIFERTYPSIYSWWMAEGWRETLKARSDQGHYFWELRSCTYYEEFERPKILSTKISLNPAFALDLDGNYLANTSYFFPAERASLVCAVLNSSIGYYLSKQIFVQKQGGFYEVQPSALEAMPIPTTTPEQEALITVLVDAILAGAQPRSALEALINAFVYELFFVNEVAAAGSPFKAARDAGLPALSSLNGPGLARAAEDWARILSDPESVLHRTLFALQSLEPIRIIEGRI